MKECENYKSRDSLDLAVRTQFESLLYYFVCKFGLVTFLDLRFFIIKWGRSTHRVAWVVLRIQ